MKPVAIELRDKILSHQLDHVLKYNVDRQIQFIMDRKDVNLYTKTPGEEHYHFLSVISEQVENTRIYDIGTYKGLSAIALAHNPMNFVVSYDIGYHVRVDRPSNVEFRVGNFYDDEEGILKSPLIFMDIDPHDGIQERKFYEFLVENEYTGLLMLDDIHQFEGMKKFWNSIFLPKYDLTKLGHWSGTGLVDFTDL